VIDAKRRSAEKESIEINRQRSMGKWATAKERSNPIGKREGK